MIVIFASNPWVLGRIWVEAVEVEMERCIGVSGVVGIMFTGDVLRCGGCRVRSRGEELGVLFGEFSFLSIGAFFCRCDGGVGGICANLCGIGDTVGRCGLKSEIYGWKQCSGCSTCIYRLN